MPASSASASSEPAGGRALIVGVNWLGDAIMSMPALQALRARASAAHLALLVKPKLRPLWQMHAAPSALLTLEPGAVGLWRTVAAVRAGGFAAAWVLPNSYRAALVPWLAGVPARHGYPGQPGRAGLLTHVAAPAAAAAGRHQAWEYLELLTAADSRPATPPWPQLTVPAAAAAMAREQCREWPRPRVALLPGAARGPSKRWPHFAALGRLLRARAGAGLVLLGAADEAAACAEIAAALGGAALNLAGRTSLPELAAVLQASDVVVGNDSGGIHLAAAVGTPVVGLYGLTDPARTAPLGPRVRILQRRPGGERDVPRDSLAARASLAALPPEEVLAAAQELLAAGRAGAAEATP